MIAPRGPLVSASALKRHCGYQRKLGRERKPTPSQKEALEKGTKFHALVEAWLLGATRPPHQDDVFDEPLWWFDDMRATWMPPPGAETEIALGLRPDGKYTSVVESSPHVYVSPSKTPLLTAGRADLLWRELWTDGAVTVVADLKTGAWPLGDPGSLLQLMALGLAAASRNGDTLLRLGIYYARDAAWEWSERIDLRERGAELLAEVREAALLDETPRPGPWCAGCWENRNCNFRDNSGAP